MTMKKSTSLTHKMLFTRRHLASHGFGLCHPALHPISGGFKWRSNIYPTTGSHRVIRDSAIVGVKEFFEPLYELKVILKPTFNQTIYRNNLKSRQGWPTIKARTAECQNIVNVKGYM